MHLLPLLPLLFWLSGSSIADPITGPARVRGTERDSLSVQCRYVSGWETHRKWWCRGADWSSCKILIQTTGSEQEVKKDRVSIRDDQENLTITVTMEALRRGDADTYWCGIERIGTDHGVQVEVTVDPAPTTVPTTTPSTSTFTTTVMATVTPRKNKGSLNLSSHHSDDRFSIMKPSILVPLIFATLLLFSVAVSLLVWRRAKRQKKAAGMSPEQVPQSLEGELCYANLTLQTKTPRGSSRKKASTKSSSAQDDQAEVEYVTMAPLPSEEVSYASLTLDVLDQEPTYGNTSYLVTCVPNVSSEEPTEYSTIRKS